MTVDNLYRRTLAALALAALASAPDACAQVARGADPQASPGSAAPASAPIPQPPAAAPVPLTLDEVLRRAEANYPKLVGADAQRRAAVAKRISKAGAFDPVAFSGSEFLRFNSTSTRGKEVTATTTDVGAEITTRQGIKLLAGARLNVGSVKAPDSSTGTGGEWIVGAKVPLARGLGMNEKLALERQAILGVPLADQDFALTRLDALLAASAAYWEWVAAGRKRAVAADLLRLAEVRAEGIRERFRQRDVPGIDVVEAETEVQRRQGGLIKAQRDLEKAAFKLSLYLWDGEGDAPVLPAVEQLPDALPEPVAPDPAEIAAGAERAVRTRPELRSLALAQEIVQVDVDLARNDRRPIVDLVIQPGLDTGSLAVGETLKAGVAFSVPLYQREARGREQEARLKQEKFRQEQVLAEQTVRTEVADAASALRTTYERYRAAQQELALSQRLEQGERDRFAAGDSTLFLVNQRERATAEAAARLIDVQAEFETARATFRAVTVQL